MSESFDFFALPHEVAEIAGRLRPAKAFTLGPSKIEGVTNRYFNTADGHLFASGDVLYIGDPHIQYGGRERFDDYNVFQLNGPLYDGKMLVRGTALIGSMPMTEARDWYQRFVAFMKERAATGRLTNPDVPGSVFPIMVTRFVAQRPDLALKTDRAAPFVVSFIAE